MIIYKTTNLINGKIYIGQSKTNNKQYLGSGKLLKRSIEKYGRENFKKEILCRCENQSDLNKLERFWISEYNSTDLNIGYNLETGGNSHEDYSWSVGNDEWKNKISKSLRGKIQSKETIEKRVAKLKGRKRTEETKKKMAEKAIGRKHTQETLEKMSKAKLGKTWEEIFGETAKSRRENMSKRLLGNKQCVGRTPWNKGLRGLNK